MSDLLRDETASRQNSLQSYFLAIRELADSGPVTLHEILYLMHGRSQALVALFLSIPFSLPIPLPGLSMVFGLFISSLGISIATGWRPWLPQRILHRQIPHPLLLAICNKSVSVFSKVERFIKPRFSWAHNHRFAHLLNGCALCVLGLLLALPLPPGTNFPPGLAIIVLSVGALEEDGFWLIIGYLLFVLNLAFFSLIPILGYEVILHFFFPNH